MPRLVCSYCGERRGPKLATAYWAWFRADGVRTCWKVFYCVDDASNWLTKQLSNGSSTAENAPMSACLQCGTDTTQDLDPVFCTLYLPGLERQDFDIPLCGHCAAVLRSDITSRGIHQPNRQEAQTLEPVATSWAALGLVPRESFAGTVGQNSP